MLHNLALKVHVLRQNLKNITMKQWILIANWIISPLWFALAWFICALAYRIYVGEAVYGGPLDLLLTILAILFLLPFAAIQGFSHRLPELALYYLISGTLIYIIHRHIHKSKGLVRDGYSGNP